MSDSSKNSSGLVRFISTIPILVLLLTVIAFGTGEKSHSRLLAIGDSVWPGYFKMRVDPVQPSCNPQTAGEVQEAPAAAEEEGDALDDLDDLFGEEDEVSEEDKAASQLKAKQDCLKLHADYKEAVASITTGVRVYRSVETSVAAVIHTVDHYSKHILILMLLIAGLVATMRREHIALRPAKSVLDHRISSGSQFIAHVMLTYSAYSFWQIDVAAGHLEDQPMHIMWMLGFFAMAAQTLIHTLRPPEDAEENGTIGHALLTIPLFTTMALVSGYYFLFSEGHPAGLSIYLGKLAEHRMLYLAVGLYVWVGMLLKQTRLATLAFDVLRPWKLTPELMAFVVVAFSAIPTAYSGASGIFVIAAGAVIYDELRRAGARKQLALAATAMSGSIGVVLRPCLLVVIVASLNKQVTTDELFGWGWKIYVLTALLFLVVSLVSRQGPLEMAPPSEAIPGSLKKLKPLAPYAFIGFVIWAFYHFVLSTPVNEHTASVILPVVLLVLLAYDKYSRRKEGEDSPGFRVMCVKATSETSGHIGALLMLMSLSICLGGIVERSEIMNLFPQSFGTPMATMGLLVVALVIIGMTMDPYGAVILVTASIADVAYRNGIDPVHFWMVVIVAFELGYLTPPVALNHLLTRQVIGEEEYKDMVPEGAGFWLRHERILLPMVVLAITLVLVAFVPFYI